MTIKERLRSKTLKDSKGCHVWQGKTINKWGYARILVGSRTDGSRKMRFVHRIAHEVFIGEIPDGYTIDHLCKNTLCINPKHLEAVTMTENNRRKRKPNCGVCGAKFEIKNSRQVCVPCRRKHVRNYMRRTKGITPDRYRV